MPFQYNSVYDPNGNANGQNLYGTVAVNLQQFCGQGTTNVRAARHGTGADPLQRRGEGGRRVGGGGKRGGGESFVHPLATFSCSGASARFEASRVLPFCARKSGN